MRPGFGKTNAHESGISPEFNPHLRGTSFDARGVTLVRNFQTLDRIAEAAELTQFTAFADHRAIPEELDGPPDELDQMMGEWTEWFDPAAGRVAIQALIEHIQTYPKEFNELDDGTGVVTELVELVRVLLVAESEGSRFRLQMN